MTYRLYYDFLIEGYQYWSLLVVSVIAGVFLTFLLALPLGRNVLAGSKYRATLILGLILLVVIPGTFFESSYRPYAAIRKLVEAGQVASVEGQIADYEPSTGSRGDANKESFKVGSVTFEYDWYSLRPGIARTKLPEEVIREGLFARIKYVDYGNRNIIVSLEVGDSR